MSMNEFQDDSTDSEFEGCHPNELNRGIPFYGTIERSAYLAKKEKEAYKARILAVSQIPMRLKFLR